MGRRKIMSNLNKILIISFLGYGSLNCIESMEVIPKSYESNNSPITYEGVSQEASSLKPYSEIIQDEISKLEEYKKSIIGGLSNKQAQNPYVKYNINKYNKMITELGNLLSTSSSDSEEHIRTRIREIKNLYDPINNK